MLTHALAYPAAGELWTGSTLLGLAMTLPLLWRVVRTSPQLFPVRRRSWRHDLGGMSVQPG